MKQDSVYQVTYTLSHAVRRPDAPPGGPHPPGGLAYYTRGYSTLSMKATDGFSWVRRWLRAGLLPEIVRLEKHYPSPNGGEVDRLLAFPLFLNLVYLSVLRDVHH